VASKLSDREYLKQLLDGMEGKTNHMKAKKIARLFGGRLWQRFSQQHRAIATGSQSHAEMDSTLSRSELDGVTRTLPFQEAAGSTSAR
jgi:hypothetical protein